GGPVSALLLAGFAVQAAEPSGGHAAAGGEGAHDIAATLMHHVLDQPLFLGPFSKHLVFFVFAALLVILMARLALRSYAAGRVPRGLGAFVDVLVVFIRDEVAEKNIGHGDGAKFAPLLCSFFFFILVAALLGLTPFAATSTGNIAVTMALATVSFLAQQWAGISKHGVVHHFAGIVPPGLPAWLLPVMIPVEIVSMFTKPFALMIRLFANMLAGHMVITTLLLLVPLMAQVSTVFGVSMIPVSLGLSLFIMALEILVAFIQAYIFTLLSAIFIGMYAHPAH
ncbi:MAG TPA: F0F1 ATP synthase subunit A, partial [Vicinamibacteria bacterium]|nr:F0F1 ATP synthase subunit A [Vicinamibacteria bacterium]